MQEMFRLMALTSDPYAMITTMNTFLVWTCLTLDKPHFPSTFSQAAKEWLNFKKAFVAFAYVRKCLYIVVDIVDNWGFLSEVGKHMLLLELWQVTLFIPFQACVM